MYSDKQNINILCSVMLGHSVHHVVVCPGSRNAPIVHNFNESPDVTCYPVTDERSAGFFALGMAQELQQPVAVCVTSGTALLDVAPAVAEARHRQLPLIVISADRPAAHIGQQMGQTLDQPGALARFTLKDVNLVEPHDDLTRLHCNRMANEALIAARRGPVHINVPYDEPLFNFTVPALPAERIISQSILSVNPSSVKSAFEPIYSVQRPMLVIGQLPQGVVTHDILHQLQPHVAVLVESLGSDMGGVPFDEVLPLVAEETDYRPDAVIYMGGTLVSKHIKNYLKNVAPTLMIQVSEEGEVHDTFGHLTQLMTCDYKAALQALCDMLASRGDNEFAARWNQLLQKVQMQFDEFRPGFSQLMAVKMAMKSAQEWGESVRMHFANSQPVRLANIYVRKHVFCNRGVNGIEGSTSAAAGCAAVTDDRVLCVTGDLSFFYDQNALWNTNLHGNLRILLLNNGGGGIFRQLKGLEASPARDKMVAGGHMTHAQGCCIQHNVLYSAAYGSEDLSSGITWLIQSESDRPLLLEVVTRPEKDTEVWNQIRKTLKIK